MEAANTDNSNTSEKSCFVCSKDLKRPRRFLLDGVVTHFCLACMKVAPTVPFGNHYSVQIVIEFLEDLICNLQPCLSFYSTVGESKGHVVCEDCSEIFADSKCLRRHRQHQHSLEKLEFPCTECEKKYSRKDQLDHHFKQNHGVEKTKPKSTNANASECSKLIKKEMSSLASTHDESSPSRTSNSSSSLELPRKRRAADEEVASFEYLWNGFQDESADHGQDEQMFATHSPPMSQMETWCHALAMDLEKMPQSSQIQMKVKISILIGQEQMEILARNGDSVQAEETAETSSAAENPIKSEVE